MPVESDFLATARSLLNIEVNTILRDNITAELAPPWQAAMLQVAEGYQRFLLGLGVALAPFFAAGADAKSIVVAWSDPAGLDPDQLTASADTFDRLHWAARNAVLARGTRPTPGAESDWAVLERICASCKVLQAIATRIEAAAAANPGQEHAFQPTVDDLGAIQKMWDLGTEAIVAQTVVYLKGDVVTRLQPSLLRPELQGLFAIHRQSVDVSVANWHSLLDATCR